MKFKSVEFKEEQSVTEVEKAAIEAVDQPPTDTPPVETPPVDTPPVDVPPTDTKTEISDDDILAILNKRYEREEDSLDKFNERVEIEKELPEDVSAFAKYKKETGRGMNDFMKVQRNLDEADENEILRDYISKTEEGLDRDDIALEMSQYEFDEEDDDPAEIKLKKLAKKKAVTKATKFLKDEQAKYKAPLESRDDKLPEDLQEKLAAFDKYSKGSEDLQAQNKIKRDWFKAKTDEVFNEEFKGFGFEVEGKKLTFTPGDSKELKSSQMELNNFVNKFKDKDGLISDAKGYHRALSIAMNPDKFAEFMFKQGLSAGLDGSMKDIKNINMDDRQVLKGATGDKPKYRAINADSGSGLKIKKPRS